MDALVRRLLGAVLLVAGSAHAQTWQDTLRARDVNRDGTIDAYYDTSLDITWLADWRHHGDGHGDGTVLGGGATWSDASSRVAAFSFFGATDWRLPAAFNTNPSTIQYTDTEIGHLSGVTLGLAPGGCLVYECSIEYAEYMSPIANAYLWDSYIIDLTWADPPSPYHPDPWLEFSFFDGRHGSNTLPTGMVTAVHDGDVFTTVSAIPEPSTYALMAIGLLGVAGAARRRHRALHAGGSVPRGSC